MTKRELKSKVNARVLQRKARKNRAVRAKTKKYHSGSGGGKGVKSTKIGAGFVSAIRSRNALPMDSLHKRNHRSNEMMGPQFT